MHHEELRDLSVRRYYRVFWNLGLFSIDACGEDSRKWGFAPDWMLSGSRGSTHDWIP